MTLYSASGIKKIYNGKTVLDLNSLEIEQGNIYTLLGPNGAGKTTLLRILAFLDPPTKGTISFRGKDVRFSETSLQPLRKKVVMINQRPILFTTTVYKNIEFGLKVRKLPPKKREHIIKEALGMVGIQHLAHAPAHRLSGGETQRVALARAFALSPEVLLCDEPTSSVDLENQSAVINILKQVNEQKQITIIFTTHDRLQAAALATRTMFLDHGKQSAAAGENIFTADLKEGTGDSSLCMIQNMVELNMPVRKTGKVRLFVDPEKINIINKPGKNCAHGKVVQVSEEKERIRITVDTGVFFTLLMTVEKYRGTNLLVGDQIYLHIPPEAIQVQDI